MVLAREYLNKYYPKNGVCQIRGYNHGETRAEITQLHLSDEQLTGQLDLTDFGQLKWLNCLDNQINELILPNSGNLKRLDCDWNKLTNLDLSNCVNLIGLGVNNNQLTSFNYAVLNPQTLTHLYLSKNNLPPTDLSVFSPLVNLEGLHIGNNNEEKINQNLYNRFTGSLQSLQNLTKLESLGISNTDINQGVEYLPVSISTLYYDTKKRPNCQLKDIEKELTEFERMSSTRWKERGFSLAEVNQWIKLGFKNNEFNLVTYLKRVKKLNNSDINSTT